MNRERKRIRDHRERETTMEIEPEKQSMGEREFANWFATSASTH